MMNKNCHLVLNQWQNHSTNNKSTNYYYKKMKKHLIFLIALALSVGMLAVQGLSAQKRVIKVQGHPHEYLTNKLGDKEDATTTRTAVPLGNPGDTTYINPTSIQCWIDEPKLIPGERIDSAYLIIKWTDRKDLDSMFVWGYRWNPIRYGDSIPHHGIDMLRSVVNNDKRLSTLLQYTGASGHAVGGFGLNMYNDGSSCSRVTIDFNIADAQHNDPDSVYFSYFAPNEYCSEGQVTVPKNANNSLTYAKSEYDSTRILMSPFGAEYGAPSYDFDFWSLTGYIQTSQHWQSGWVRNGYWSYYRADDWRVPIPNPILTPPYDSPDAAGNSITYERLRHRQVHAFVFRPRIPLSKYDYQYEVHYFDGTFRFMDCGCAPCPQNVTGK
jgi:hypothetical protein